MAERPNYMIIVTHEGQAGIKCVSAHVTEADTYGMVNLLTGIMAPGSTAYLIPIPAESGIVGDVIEPLLKPVAAEKAPAPLPMAREAPQQPAKPPVPFRRLSQDAFLSETEAMLENGGWRDADAPLSDGGAIS